MEGGMTKRAQEPWGNRTGELIGIIRIQETRWGDPATFGTIDGEAWYGVPAEAAIGDTLALWEEGGEMRPMRATRSYVLSLTRGDPVVEEHVANTVRA